MLLIPKKQREETVMDVCAEPDLSQETHEQRVVWKALDFVLRDQTK